jgi:hypothetical protein
MGQGSRTGRGAGFCNGNTAPGFASSGGRGLGGGGFGRGRGVMAGGFGFGGGGRGYRNMYNAAPMMNYAAPVAAQPQDETLWLKNQAEALQSELKTIESRLAELNKADK